MNTKYGIFVMENQQQKLLDRLDEINDGKLNHHPKKQVDKLREDIIQKSKDLQFAINLLKDCK